MHIIVFRQTRNRLLDVTGRPFSFLDLSLHLTGLVIEVSIIISVLYEFYLRQIRKLLNKRAKIVGELCMGVLSEVLWFSTKMQPHQKQYCDGLHHLIFVSPLSTMFTEFLVCLPEFEGWNLACWLLVKESGPYLSSEIWKGPLGFPCHSRMAVKKLKSSKSLDDSCYRYIYGVENHFSVIQHFLGHEILQFCEGVNPTPCIAPGPPEARLAVGGCNGGCISLESPQLWVSLW